MIIRASGIIVILVNIRRDEFSRVTEIEILLLSTAEFIQAVEFRRCRSSYQLSALLISADKSVVRSERILGGERGQLAAEISRQTSLFPLFSNGLQNRPDGDFRAAWSIL